MTLVVLALDALDAALVDYWDLDDLRLNHYTQMETFANMREDPYTPEVWATVATGLPPDEHGVTEEGTSEWSNPLVDFASQFTGVLPLHIRAKLGHIARRTTGSEYELGRTDEPTVFDGDGRVVKTWPGAGESEHVVGLWDMMKPPNDTSHEVFRREVLGLGVQHLAWAEEMLNHNVVLAGTHVHTLDVCGHNYARDEDRYQAIYRWIADWVVRIRNALDDDDDLLILSDHGINTEFCEVRDKHPGSHSFRAYAATTTADPPPTSVFDVRDWIEHHVDPYQMEDGEAIEVPEDTLRELGYIE